MTSEAARFVAHVSGRVQGVGFRDWARRRGEALGLRGTAVNLADGRVRIDAQGPRGACLELLHALYGSEPPGRVHDVRVEWLAPEAERTRFRTG